MSIKTIINYCTNDQRFINLCIDSVRNISCEITVTYTDCFYDGTPENINLIDKTIVSNPDVNFIKISYESNKRREHEWCSYSRIVGYNSAKKETDYVLFLDSDEIIESKTCSEFINSDQFIFGHDYKLEGYFYFRDVKYQALQLEDAAPLLYTKNLNINNVMLADRTSLFLNTPNIKHRHVTYDGQVLMHHYSWARSKQEMLKKVKSWGHKHDRNWSELIENEFSHDFNGTDFINGYKYKILPSSLI